eukprot:CAMPEP_0201117972 /NCGR_PEP_ID=MMETSP0850-20130426/2059_1 /ASSEMBLY_ACC=CAM_ASM_000622 /TAXON_ID=183588 /ORGANISM="Pseudo-nitzschia fraudulenta, Strain WWA7" /LENGTH=242 /DNA_ID=CAMNT_0047382809 /DNA_START=39 /DNA_END=767 /DNA_ORIENTATION=+
MELEAGSNTMYQVHYSEEEIGKMIKNSKVRITWNFASNGGREQHEVTLTWSKSTGKQEITMDGTEVWFGRNMGRSVLDHNWNTRDGSLKMHVLATCAPKMNEDFRSFDLLINGQLFASLPGSDDSSVPAPPTMYGYGNNNLVSILQILYPDGYIPPVDKDEQQRQEEREKNKAMTALQERDRNAMGAIQAATTTVVCHKEANASTGYGNYNISRVAPIGGFDTPNTIQQTSTHQPPMIDLLS